MKKAVNNWIYMTKYGFMNSLLLYADHRVSAGLPLGVGSGRSAYLLFSKVGCVGSAYFCTSDAYDVSYTQSK